MASQVPDSVAVGDESEYVALVVVLLKLDEAKRGSSGDGLSGRVGEEGVAFSMRAQVR